MEKNYITPSGLAALRAEAKQLLEVERPQVVERVAWAASNGDRSENGDYLYGKRRLREIDRRVRFLTKRMQCAVVVNPSVHAGSEQVFFGATVTYVEPGGQARTVTIKGVDETDSLRGEVSWVSPVGRALLRSRVGDAVRLHTPQGPVVLEVDEVSYPAC